MQADVNGYNVNGYHDKEHHDKEHSVNEYTVDNGSQSPALVDKDFSCLNKESNSSPQARLSVGVPRGVYKQLKLLAHDRDMTISALLIQLIKAEIQSLDAMDL